MISIVVCTYNEQDNIVPLLQGIAQSMQDTPHEVLVVDDGDDRTMELAIQNGARIVLGQHKGLGQAMIDGVKNSRGEIVVLMDADLSHAPSDIPRLIQPIVDNKAEFTLGSRYVDGGGSIGWGLKRRLISRFAGLMAWPVTKVKDNTSGFFAFRKAYWSDEVRADSWKVMLEVLIKGKPPRVMEIPIMFKDRESGKSKFNTKQVAAYLKHLMNLYFYKFRILRFMVVGGIGLVTNLLLMYLLTSIIGVNYLISFIISFLVAATQNYLMNKWWTFGDRKEASLGYVRYIGVTGLTLVLDESLLWLFTDKLGVWYEFSAFFAVAVAFIARYVLSGVLIWKTKKSQTVASAESPLKILRL